MVQLEQGKEALVIVDVQNDFLPGGRLAVPGGDEVIPVLNRYIAGAERDHLPIFATRDWHPPNHCSFRTQGGQWPVHCVMETEGAGFPASLRLPSRAVLISKGMLPDKEAYSGFEGTALEERLHGAGVGTLYVGGLATDYCVLNTVKDALNKGFRVFLLKDAVRAVNLRPEDGRNAEQEMRRFGALAFQLVEWPECAKHQAV
ncbi:MAG TPA: isochorismatase family protein [Verrucomicrobiae bacterium]|nr:isochorismatase family protein [Verrucomicrobiae bacterium]